MGFERDLIMIRKLWFYDGFPRFFFGLSPWFYDGKYHPKPLEAMICGDSRRDFSLGIFHGD